MASAQQLSTDKWGIQTRWVNANDEHVDVPTDVLEALRSVIGQPPPNLDDLAPIVTRPGGTLPYPKTEIVCEDGSTHVVDGDLPDDFPLGYHTLRADDGVERRLIVSPGKCYLPDGLRLWGLTVQLYAARSSNSWGMGDLADLRAIREWAESVGAGFLLINPLMAVAPVHPIEASPYLPVTRRFRNPIYLAIDDVPGADRVELGDLRARGPQLNDNYLIDRDATWALKLDALRRIYRARTADADFDGWRASRGAALQDFAVWCVLAELHGSDFRDWDEPLRNPRSDEVRAIAADHADQVTFHAWLQWSLDVQLRSAVGDLPVIQDLPIGVDGGGADAWAWQGQVAAGPMIGAPPDLYVPAGQNWGSPPMVPWRVRADGYQAFIESIRATIAGSGGLRIDHVMGLFRLWWVSPGGDPKRGAYIRYPSDDLLDIVALESHRAQAFVVGEDLGTVEDGVREALADHNMLSYRLVLFEDIQPEHFPIAAMAAMSTHDLPTIAGLWTGRDAEEQLIYTTTPAVDIVRGREAFRVNVTDPEVPRDADVATAIDASHRKLLRVPSMFVSVSLEDAVGAARRPNMPGAPDRDNWCIPLPIRVDDLAIDAAVSRMVDLVQTSLDV